MNTIYKYTLHTYSYQKISIYRHFKPLSVQYQNEDLCLWAEVNTDHPIGLYEVRLIGTGQELNFDTITDDWKYISTVQDGMFVWHVYINMRCIGE